MSNSLYLMMAMLDGADVGGSTPVEQVKNLLADYKRLLAQVRVTARQTDRERLMASLNDDRCETLMLLHECCLDEGLLDQAKGWGWLWCHRRWPVRLQTGVWHWTVACVQPGSTHQLQLLALAEHCLPTGLFRAIHVANAEAIDRGRPLPGWTSARAALKAVVDTIASGAWTGSAPEAPGPFAPLGPGLMT